MAGTSQTAWNDAISDCSRNFGEPPRQFSLWDRMTYLRMPTPSWTWFDTSDNLTTLFQRRYDLLASGVVTWGAIIQANALMWSPGSDNCPGEIVYSSNCDPRVDPEFLGQVAGRLGELKGTAPSHPDLAGIANYLTDEWTRVFGLPVPLEVSDGVPCSISTTFFYRHHLPDRLLTCPLLPMVASLDNPRVVLPLPGRFWPPWFAHWWQSC